MENALLLDLPNRRACRGTRLPQRHDPGQHLKTAATSSLRHQTHQRPGSANPPARARIRLRRAGPSYPAQGHVEHGGAQMTHRLFYSSRGELVEPAQAGGPLWLSVRQHRQPEGSLPRFGSTTDYETDELNRYAGIVRNGGSLYPNTTRTATRRQKTTGIWTVTTTPKTGP